MGREPTGAKPTGSELTSPRNTAEANRRVRSPLARTLAALSAGLSVTTLAAAGALFATPLLMSVLPTDHAVIDDLPVNPAPPSKVKTIDVPRRTAAAEPAEPAPPAIMRPSAELPKPPAPEIDDKPRAASSPVEPSPPDSMAPPPLPPAPSAAEPAVPPLSGTAESEPQGPIAPPAQAPAGKKPAAPPVAAKVLFGAVKAPAQMITRAIGYYAKGCLAGAKPLPVNGPEWQAMRLSRNRNWGHPSLVSFIEQLAADAKAIDSWPGLLVGDMSQPRGGPMASGHASHQVGLDVDIWYKPMPDHQLTAEEREQIPLASVLKDPSHVDPEAFTVEHQKLVRRAAAYPSVERVFVHPAIKKHLCEETLEDRQLLRKIRPIWGHDDHFHVRLICPADSGSCQHQPPPANDEGCGQEIDHWLAIMARRTPAAAQVAPAPAEALAPTAPAAEALPQASPAPAAAVPAKQPAVKAAAPAAQAAAKPAPVIHGVTLEQLPAECKAVLAAAPASVVQQQAGR